VVEVNTDLIVALRRAGIHYWDDIPAPTGLRLEQNYPNPVGRATDIRYSLPRACWAKLEIYNILGQKVATLVDEAQEAGYKSVRWDCTNQSGGRVASGLYFYRLKAGDSVQKKKMIVLR
jgi:hypothetical protein